MGGLGGRQHRRTWQVISVVCAFLIIATAAFAFRQISHGGLTDGGVGVVGLLLTALSVVVAVAALRRRPEGNDAELALSWAKTLASRVLDHESKVRNQLLGKDTKVIDLTYVLDSATERAATAQPAGRTLTDASTALPGVLDYYRATRPQRLVITGPAGAGKTVLALELMLALVGVERAEKDPVPIRISLSQWDTTQSLASLLEQHLVDIHECHPEQAEGLVRHKLVLPVLEGLDEMDPLRDDGTPDPRAPRARAVLKILNKYTRGGEAGPFILTCRTSHYDALVSAAHLVDSARVVIAPVEAPRVVGYLRDRVQDFARWQPVVEHLERHPTGLLAETLSTPWRLCLAATVYRKTGDPSELLRRRTAHELDKHLLARYIPAVTESADAPSRYRPDEVHGWLYHLTRHLDGTVTGAPATDLTLHRLWPLAGPRVDFVDGLLSALTVLLTLPLAWTTRHTYTNAALIVAFALVAGVRALPPPHAPRRLTRFRASRPALLIALFMVLCGALLTPVKAGVVFALVFGVACGLVALLLAGMDTGAPTTVASPGTVIRDDAIRGFFAGFALAVAVGLPLVVAAGPAVGLTLGTLLLFTGPMSADAARRYGVFLLCSRGRLPFRLVRFLDWAVTAGLLRYNGASYQFRHRELQQWVSRRPRPDTT